jgi:hypothetical protein
MEKSYLRLFIMVIAARDIQIARMLAVFVWGPSSSNSNQCRLSVNRMQQGLHSRQLGGRGEEDFKSLLDGHQINRLLSQILQNMGFKGPSKGGSIVLQFDKG